MTKKKIILTLRITALVVGIVCTIIFPPWRLMWARLQPLPDTIQEQVDKAPGYGFEGIIVYIDEPDKPAAFYTAGWHDRDNKIPAYPEALFKLASIDKLYAAVAITKLVGDERLSLDGTLADYFPEFADRIEYAEKITLRTMVQHRSGIPNLTDTPNFWTDPPNGSEEALARVFDLPANFAPGEDYEYSNTNYLLISKLITKTVGYSHGQYIKEEILVPLELSNTFSSINDVEIDDVMSGYHVGVDEDIKTDDYGSMLASAEDVGIFLRALNDGSVFTEEERAIYSDLYVYDHTGLIPGYQSIARYHKDIDTVVIQFTNTSDFSDYTHWAISETIYNRIIKILRN
jgi:CubicO group peptidase (beta-lactamase class C family)